MNKTKEETQTNNNSFGAQMEENCHVEPITKASVIDQTHNTDSALLAIWGMGCENCATRVRNNLLSLEGVYSVDMMLNMAMAEVNFDGKKVSTQMLVDAVSGAGNDGRHHYRAELIAA